MSETLPLLVGEVSASGRGIRTTIGICCAVNGAVLLLVSLFVTTYWQADTSDNGNHPISNGGPGFSIDLDKVINGSNRLWGSFYEEINHAGEGGMYAELLQDRSFDALVNTLGPNNHDPMTSLPKAGLQDNPMPWTVLHGSGRSTVTLVSEAPAISLHGVSGDRRRAVKISASTAQGGLANSGFWGIPVEQGRQYNLTVWAATWSVNSDPNAANSSRCPSVSTQNWAIDIKLVVGANASDLVSANSSLLASVSFVLSCQWKKFTAILTPTLSAKEAFLTITTNQASDILIDHVSLFPLWTAEELAELAPIQQIGGSGGGAVQPWPFRPDLFMMLKNLKPRFLRFPGGCFVEGDRLADAEHWKNTVGPLESRPGHWNLWGYWSTDGLGLYEYMLLSEALGAEPVWVTNAGMAHQDQVLPSQVMPWIQEALDGLEFIMGPADSRWGAVRAAMGHPEPFKLNYLAVGNEDAGLPFYTETYIMFWAVLKNRYPDLKLIANDEIHPVGALPNDIWDFHVYTESMRLFNMSNYFDSFDPSRSSVFVSEFAVIRDAGRGNMLAAVAEAAFMTGLERNADKIELASYAPLFVNVNDRRWSPDMIVFDGTSVYGTPSYWVAHLFSQSYFPVMPHLTSVLPDGSLLRASAVCTSFDCAHLHIRIINMHPIPQAVEVSFITRAGFPDAQLKEHVVLAGQPTDENTLTAPTKVSPKPGTAGAVTCTSGRTCTVTVQPTSVNFLSFDLATSG